MHKGWGRVGGCSLCDLAVRTLEAVDGKTDEISYRFPIVNARKLSPSFLSFSLSLSQPRIGLSLSLLFYPPLYGIFFRDRECTRVNEQLSKKERKKKERRKNRKRKENRKSCPTFLHIGGFFQALFLFSLRASPSFSSSPFVGLGEASLSLVFPRRRRSKGISTVCQIFVRFHLSRRNGVERRAARR